VVSKDALGIWELVGLGRTGEAFALMSVEYSALQEENRWLWAQVLRIAGLPTGRELAMAVISPQGLP